MGKGLAGFEVGGGGEGGWGGGGGGGGEGQEKIGFKGWIKRKKILGLEGGH